MYLMYRHPWISSFFGVCTFISILATIILVSWARFLQNEEASISMAHDGEPHDRLPLKPTTASPSVPKSSPTTTFSELESEGQPRSKSAAAAKSSELEVTSQAKSSLARRISWFLVKHLVWKSTKLFVAVTVCVVLYEIAMQGVDTNNLDLLIEATKQDLVILADYVNQKFLVLVELVRQKMA